MGRPRHGTDLKRKLSIRLSEEAITALDAHGTNRSALIESLILAPQPTLADALEAKIAALKPAKRRREPPSSLIAAMQQVGLPPTTETLDGLCPHPKEQRIPLSFGGGYRCQLCDTVIRTT